MLSADKYELIEVRHANRKSTFRQGYALGVFLINYTLQQIISTNLDLYQFNK